MTTFFYVKEFLALSLPSQTGLIKVAESFFLGTLIVLVPAMIMVFVLLVRKLINVFINPEKNKRERDWED